MLNIDAANLLKYENVQLQEELVYYQAEIADLRAVIQDLEDEKQALKAKLERLHIGVTKANGRYRLGAHFPENLLKYTRTP